MARKKSNTDHYNPLSPNTLQMYEGNSWFVHYYTHLSNLAMELFEWENLPTTVSPKFLEMQLHSAGMVGFLKHETYGFIAVNGAENGIDIYNNPLTFEYVNAVISGRFKNFTYADMDKENDSGVIIYNNDLKIPTFYTIRLFAQELAKTHEIMNVNLNAQKTPVIIKTTNNKLFSSKQTYNQFEGNVPAIVVDETFNVDDLKAIDTQAPYIVDKVNQHRLELYNAVLSFLGVNNVNTGKKERLITDEANSNNDMIANSGGIMLKARLEACELINELYGLNVSVNYRQKEFNPLFKDSDLNTMKDGAKNE